MQPKQGHKGSNGLLAQAGAFGAAISRAGVAGSRLAVRISRNRWNVDRITSCGDSR